MKDRNGIELERGDILLISVGNYIISGIFIKPGGSNNLNFYRLSNYVLTQLINNGRRLDYLASSFHNEHRYVKITKDLLIPSEQHLYDEIIKLI